MFVPQELGFQLKAAALKFLEGVEETARQANLKVGLKCEASDVISPYIFF